MYSEVMRYRNRLSRRHLAYVACAIAAATGVIGGLGHLIQSPVLAGLSSSYIPMAPSTVATILLVSGGLTAHIMGATQGSRLPATHLRAAVVVPAGLVAFVGPAVIAGRLGPFDLDVEGLVLGRAREFFGAPEAAVPLGRMSPLTAAIALSDVEERRFAARVRPGTRKARTRGSARSSATGATEEAAWRRPVRSRGRGFVLQQPFGSGSAPTPPPRAAG
ncbi:MAG: hypothetical protein ACYC5Q_13145 [Thermoleophilia bacterium]